MFIYVNGEIVHQNDAKISAYDHGYMYGLGLFETIRVEEGHPFLFDDHFKRLQVGLTSIGIHWAMEKEEVLSVICDLLKENDLENAYVRWNVSAGPSELGLVVDPYEQPTTIVYMKPLPPIQNESKDAVILALRRNTPEGQFRLKSHHFLNNALAKRELGTASNKEGIFLNEAGYLAEGVVSNVFWIKNDTVYTPTIETGILDGITRRFILEVLKQEGIKIEIGWFKSDELLQADAAFITNSIQEVVPLRHCEHAVYYIHHPYIQLLQKTFRRYRTKLWGRDELQWR